MRYLLIVQFVAMTCPMTAVNSQPQVHKDQPLIQDYSEKSPLGTGWHGAQLLKVRCDRNGRTLVLSNQGLLQVHAGHLKPDHRHRLLTHMTIKDMTMHQGQFVYLTAESVLSNIWAPSSNWDMLKIWRYL